MAGNGKKPAAPAGWGNDPPPPLPTIEDRLARLEAALSVTAQLTPAELAGVRALLDRSGFDREKGSF
jgi:hypothetical protein